MKLNVKYQQQFTKELCILLFCLTVDITQNKYKKMHKQKKQEHEQNVRSLMEDNDKYEVLSLVAEDQNPDYVHSEL